MGSKINITSLILGVTLSFAFFFYSIGEANSFPFRSVNVGDSLPAALLLPVFFLISGAIAFAIGSSWGTFAIMIPIALPVAMALGFPPAPFLAAVLSGAIFGDHASPISDTTIVASMAAATDHIDHVRTQLPYALLAGGISTLGFAIMGFVFG